MIFKNPSKKKSELNLKIKGVPVGKTQTLKFLGITLTPHLRWNDHCQSLIKRANSRLFQLWRLSNLNINEESLLLVYKSWIRPLFCTQMPVGLTNPKHSLIKYNVSRIEP